MVVYMALKLTSVGGAFMIGRNSMTNFSMPDSLWIDFMKPFHDGCLSIGRFSFCFESHPRNHAMSPWHEVTAMLKPLHQCVYRYEAETGDTIATLVVVWLDLNIKLL